MLASLASKASSTRPASAVVRVFLVASTRCAQFAASSAELFAGLFCSTRQAFLDHERSKAELKALMPEDAKEAIGHGVRARRSKSGAISFDLLEMEGGRAARQ